MFSRRRVDKYTELVRNRIVDVTVVHDGQQVTAKAIHRGAVYATATERENIYAEIAHAVRQRALQEERDARMKMLENVLSTPDVPNEADARAAAAEIRPASKKKPSPAKPSATKPAAPKPTVLKPAAVKPSLPKPSPSKHAAPKNAPPKPARHPKAPAASKPKSLAKKKH